MATKKSYSELLKDPRWQKKSGIYKLNINNRIYIGSAINLPKRLQQHYNDLCKNRHHNIHLQRAFNKYKILSFEILEIIIDKKELIKKEQYYIDTLKPTLNIAPMAGSQLGFKHSKKTKERLSVIQKGKFVSLETRKKMSIAKKGWSPTPEQRKNYSLSKLGKKNPFYKAGKKHPQYGTHKKPATIEKLSGKNNKRAKSGVLYDIETDKNYLFESLHLICKRLNINYRGILSALRNKRFYKNRYYADFVFIPHMSNNDIFEISRIAHFFNDTEEFYKKWGNHETS